jgi:N-methylhydantoinase B
MNATTSKFDAVLMEVLWTRVISIVDEAAKAIVRTSFSTLSTEANDFACVITDTRGYSMAQNSGSIPSFIGTLPATVRHMMREIGIEKMHPGDVLITNDPWMGTGHLSDVCLIKPIFRGNTLVGFGATTAHVPDIGGRLRSLESRQIFEEGLQIPPMHLVRANETDSTLERLIHNNVRTPDQTLGDIWAQVGANELMSNRVLSLMDEYDLENLEDFGDELFSRTEVAMRGAISALSNGTYRFGFETDGADEPYVFQLALTVKGDEILMDFAGSSPTQPRAINCVLAYTYAMSAYAVKCALLPDLANNEGMFRPISVTAPEDTILNPRYPAAVVARSNTGHYVPVLVFGALQQIVPDRVMAGAGSPLWVFTVSGITEENKTFANVLFYNGGMGATMHADGESALSWPSNISSTPVEVSERNGPLHCTFKRLRPGSGGPGRTRGGLGQDIEFQSMSESPLVAMFMTERTKFPAAGLDGGGFGDIGVVEINGAPVEVHKQHVLKKGDKVLLRTPGGGGYGDPAERAQNQIDDDVRLGYV